MRPEARVQDAAVLLALQLAACLVAGSTERRGATPANCGLQEGHTCHEAALPCPAARSFFMAITLWTGNEVYLYLTVAFIQASESPPASQWQRQPGPPAAPAQPVEGTTRALRLTTYSLYPVRVCRCLRPSRR